MASQRDSFLPPGLALKKVVREPQWTDVIAQARIDGPAFRVKLAYMPYRLFRESVAGAQAQRQRAANPQEAEAAAMRPLLEKVLLDWEGATFENINSVLRSDRVIRPEHETPEAMAEFVKTYVDGQKPFEFNHGFASYLWFESYPERFQNPIFTKLQEWTDSIDLEVTRGKGD